MKQVTVLIACLCFLLISALPVAVMAQDETCVRKVARGEAIAEGIAPEEAMNQARSRARLAVTEELAGVTVLGNSLVKDSMMVSDLVSTLSRGSVSSCRNEQWQEDMIPSATGKGKLPHYTVTMECCVNVDKGEADPYFTLTITTGKPVYLDGEEIETKIRAGRDSYLTLFHIDPEHKATLLLPNIYQKTVRLTKGGAVTFPDNGMAMKARNNPGHKKDIEHFVAVATKEWFDIEGVVKTVKGATDAGKLFSAIASIPTAERAVSITSYEIHQGR